MAETNQEEKEKYLKQLAEDYKYSISKFDNLTTFIGGGALLISLTFIKDIVPIEYLTIKWVYYLSLGCFIASMLIGFIAHYKSAIISYDKYTKIFFNQPVISGKSIVSKLNLCILIAVISGIILLSFFTTYNIENYQKIKIKNANIMTSQNDEKSKADKNFPKTNGNKLEKKALDNLPISSEPVKPKTTSNGTVVSSGAPSQDSKSDK